MRDGLLPTAPNPADSALEGARSIASAAGAPATPRRRALDDRHAGRQAPRSRTRNETVTHGHGTLRLTSLDLCA